MKKIFTISPETFRMLLESSKEDFLQKFNQEFLLNSLAIENIFPLLSTEERKKFFLEAEISANCRSTLEKFFTKEEATELLALKKQFQQLEKPQIEKLISKDKYLDEICIFNKKTAKQWKEEAGSKDWAYPPNQQLCQMKRFDILEKHQDWVSLAIYDSPESAEILLKNERYEEMLTLGSDDCYEALYNNGYRNLVVEHLSQNKETNAHRQWDPFCFLVKKQDAEALSLGKTFTKILNHYSDWVLWILTQKEQRGENTQELWKILEERHRYLFDKFYSKEHYQRRASTEKLFYYDWPHHTFIEFNCSAISPNNSAALELWLYKNINSTDYRNSRKELYPWYSKEYRWMKKVDKLPNTLQDIQKIIKK